MQSPPIKNAATLMVVVAFATVYIVWGSTFFFIQKAMTGFPPFMLGALRFLIAAVLMLGWSWLRREKLFVFKDIMSATVSGVLMLFIGTGAVIWVEQYLPSAMVAIMVSSGPLWFILLDRPKWKENLNSRSTIGGLIMGFAGIIILFWEEIKSAFTSGTHTVALSSVGILMVASMAWAGGSLYSKYKSTSVSVPVNTAWQMLAAGIAFIPGSLIRGEFETMVWANVPVAAWLSVAYLVLFGSIAGFSAYAWLLKVKSATQVSTHAYVNPVVAVLLGVFLANERITFLQISGLLVILSSVLIINLVKYRNEKRIKEKAAVPKMERTNMSSTLNTSNSSTEKFA